MMTLGIGALAASLVAAVCSLATNRSLRVWISTALMVLAMSGCLLDASMPGMGLVAFLLSMGSAGFALARVAGRVPDISTHRALGGVTMAAMVISIGASPPKMIATSMPEGHTHGIAPGALVIPLVAAYLGHSGWPIRRKLCRDVSGTLVRVPAPRTILHVCEIASMAAGIVLMALM
jgi:hypothetical protein